MNSILFAREYAQKGWQAFPLKPRDKIPFVKWTEVATCDVAMLNGWFDNYPDANIGIACGQRSGIIVLDVDAGHGGYDSLTKLIDKYGALPQTTVSKTGSGGEHIFFKHPGIEIRNSTGKLGPGLDIRGDGGYVVAPPSIHPNGNIYEWTTDYELADMPEWMIEVLREVPKPEVKNVTPGEVVEGGRNDYLTKMAGAMRRKGFSEDAIFSALQIDNREKCRPPLTDGEVLQISKSVIRYEPEDVPQVTKPLPNSITVIELLEAEIREREKNPKDVWGIHYAWDYLSLLTGGKQKGELIYGAGEPGVGKSWFFHQDALFTAVGNPSKAIGETPVLLWSGEMKRRQVYRRFFEMLGVPKRAMLTGQMKERDKYTGELIDHWEKYEEAKAIIMNSPIYVADMALDLKDVRGMLEREIDAHGIQQAVFDYDWLISAPGQGEIEQSQNISRGMKQIANDLDISIILISSVNKMGMGQTSENVTKANLSGSGKKLHDADVIYILTKFNEKKNKDLSISPADYWKIATLHVEKAREMDYNIPGGAINYMRETPNPKFREMKLPGEKPSWMR